MRNFIFILFLFSFTFLFPQKKIDSLINIAKTGSDAAQLSASKKLCDMLMGTGRMDEAKKYTTGYIILAQKLNDNIELAYAYDAMGRFYYFNSKYDSAIALFNQGLKIRRVTRDTFGIGNSYVSIGVILLSIGKYNEGRVNIESSIPYYKLKNARKNISTCYNNIGESFRLQGIYPEAIKAYLNAVKINEELKDTLQNVGPFNNLCLVHNQLKEYDKAMNYILRSMGIAKFLDRKASIISGYMNIGLLQNQKKMRTEAIKNFSLAIDIARELKDKRDEAGGLRAIGAIYFEMKDLKEALKFTSQSYEISKMIGEVDEVGHTAGDMGAIYTDMNELNKAKSFLKEAIAISLQTGNLETAAQAYKNLYKIDFAQGNYKESVLDLKNHYTYRDSIFNKENTQKIVEAQMNAEFERKQAIEKLEQKKKDLEHENEIKGQKIIVVSVISGLLLVLIFSFFLFKRFRLTQRQKLIIEEQKVLVDVKQKEMTDSIKYARRIQLAQIPSERNFAKMMEKTKSG